MGTEAVAVADPEVLLGEIADGLRAGTMVPYLGPGLGALSGGSTPNTPEDLAEFFAGKTTLPRRAVGNAWAAAQYIESYRHRSTVTAYMAEAFGGEIVPSDFHRWLAGIAPPMIVDSWYAGEMRRALEGRDDWAEVQGTHRAVITDPAFFRYYRPEGSEGGEEIVEGVGTLLYTPHGSAVPVGNFLISDADYVEVLTEIDIQTPIPEEVRNRRTGKGFVFLGCHFHDQLLRTYSRQIMKRSGGRHYAVLDTASLTRNEERFLEEQDITPIDLPLTRAISLLMEE